MKKNTKITFYYTDLKQGEFGKTIFETIIEGTPFDDINDAYTWEEEVIFDTIWNEYGFELIFDRIIMGYEETDKDIKDVEIIKHEIGTLTFGKIKKKTSKENIETNISFANKTIDELRDSIELIKQETKEFEKDTQRIIEERIGFEEKSKSIEETIKKIKAETEKIKADTKKKKEKKKPQKVEHTSCWIEPDGTVHELSFAQHNEFASEWLQERIGLSAMVHDRRYAYEQLQEDFGWLRILGWSDPPQFVFPLRFTPKQKIAVRDYCMRERIGLPERLKS